MLRTFLLWHLTATALMLAVYVLVAGLQWSVARLPGLAVEVRRRSLGRPSVALPSARRDDESASVPLTSAA